MSEPALLAWSGGKDSALALAELHRSATYSAVGLLTTVTAEYDRISMHGVRRAILRAQATALNLPVFEASISPGAGNEEYDAAWGEAIARARDTLGSVRHVAYGDLFLEDVRQYREAQSAKLGYVPVFPLWLRDTAKLARQFIESGYQAYVTCVDTTQLDPSFAGRLFDRGFLADLPPSWILVASGASFTRASSAGPRFARRLR